MPLKILHTSDWHLGHSLRDWSREEEHRAFLGWLLDRIVEEAVDVLVVAGDLFDSSNPSAAAQQLLYGFLGRLRARHPRTRIVLVGGNHDSAARLDAAEPLLSALTICMVGSLPYRGDGHRLADLDLDRILVPLADPGGKVEAWIAAVPYLRPADFPDELSPLPMPEAVAGLYLHLSVALQQRGAGLRLATGHCFVVGSDRSEGSERVLVGGAESVGADCFPTDFAYVALGHLHKPQVIGGRLYYAGAPLPFDLGEGEYKNRVLLVEVADGAVAAVRSLSLPRWTEVQVLPSKTGAFSVDQVLAWAESQPVAGHTPLWQRPFLELRVEKVSRSMGLWTRLAGILKDRLPRLVKLTEVWGEGEARSYEAGVQLQDLLPMQVFEQRWRQRHGEEPLPGPLREAFSELLLAAQEADR
jgi:DNA repair protein SbcD/Mre11